MHHFSYGALTPTLAYVASYIGCLLGLMCAARARVLTGAGRRGWLAVAAVSLGGTGIWVMHFIAMLGFTVGDIPIRYNMVLTAISALVAIVAVGAGLIVVGDNARKLHRIAAGGLLTGVGVAGMHYMGMAAMIMPARMSYDPVLFTLSIIIAVVAAGVALWFTLVIRGRRATLAAAALMAVAVCGMHYTGMAALRLTPDPGLDTSGGISFNTLLMPLLLVVSTVTVVLLIFVAFSASPAELVEDAEFVARLRRSVEIRSKQDPGAPTPHPTTGPLAPPTQSPITRRLTRTRQVTGTRRH